MKQRFSERFWIWCGADFFSPKDFVRHAVLIWIVFLMAHLAGLRDDTSFLNGTSGSAGMDPQIAALLGLLYLLSYMAAILMAPILLIAAGISAVCQRLLFHGKASFNESGTNASPTN